MKEPIPLEEKLLWCRRLGFEPYDKQLEIMACPKRFRVAMAGRRSGKTTLAVMEAVIATLARPGSTGALLGPTRLQSDNLLSLFLRWADTAEERGYIRCEARQTTRGYFRFSNHSEVYVGNLTWPDSWRGFGFDWVVLDEASMLESPEAWYEVLQPALADRRGWAFLISTPWSGSWFNRLYRREEEALRRELWRQGLRGRELEEALKERLEWAFFQYESYHNPYAFPLGEQDPEWLRLRRSTPPEEFLQEYCALDLPPRDLIYPEFDPWVHVRENLYLPGRPVHLAIDPSASSNPYAVAVIQDLGDEVRIIDEFYQPRVTASEVIDALRERPWWREVTAAVIDSAAVHDIRVWRTHPGVHFDVLDCGKVKPQIKETVPLVASWLRNPFLWDAIIMRRRMEAMSEMGLEGPWEALSVEDKHLVELEARKKVTAEEKALCAHLFVDIRCQNTIREFQQYRYRKRRAEGISANFAETPRDFANHIQDALRYWFWRFKRRADVVWDSEGNAVPILESIARKRLADLSAIGVRA